MFNEKEIKEIEVVEEYNAEIAESVETTEEVVVAEKKNLLAEKMNLFGKKAKENAGVALQKAGEYGKIGAEKSMEVLQKAGEGMQKGFADLQDKMNDDSYQRRLKKYNPVFLEQYQADGFRMPKMIMVVSDHERRDIDVCQGAIGWVDNQNEMEVLCLYEKDVETSGIYFEPRPKLNDIYYIDNFNSTCFNRTDYMFEKAHKEKIDELQHVAYCLGAKRCIIEIKESNKLTQISKRIGELKGNLKNNNVEMSANAKVEQSSTHSNSVQRSGQIIAEFKGNSVPTKPELRWFKDDANIIRLINIRLDGNNSLEKQELHFSGAVHSMMNQATAVDIDATIKKIAGAKIKTNVERKAMNESRNEIIFKIEF